MTGQKPHSSRGWHSNRGASVKQRFIGALTMLDNGLDVFMHDADVFFQDGGLKSVFEAIADFRQTKEIRFMVQGNGRRDGTKNLVQIAAAVVDRAPRLVFANAVSPPPVTTISIQRRHRFAYRYVRRER